MEKKEDSSGFRYERYSGEEKCIDLSKEVEGRKLTCIGAKAFLSCKSMEQLKLPDTLEEVEDWAFAHAKNLKELWIPAKSLVFGKKVFLGCESLERICFTDRQTSGRYEGIPYFLGSVARFFPEDLAGALLDRLQEAGAADGQWQWLKEYDRALTALINRPDEEGFEPAFIGWFDVEDVDDQRQNYVRKRREDKIFLVFQRLGRGGALSEEAGDCLQRYLREQEEILVGLFRNREIYREDITYYKIWKRAGGLTAQQAKRLMEYQSGQGSGQDPEIVSFLLECQLEENGPKKDFFGDLDL